MGVYSLQKVISSSGLVTAILNRSSPTSGDVDIVMVRSAVVEDLEVAVGIMSVCCWKQVTSTNKKSTIFPRKVPLVYPGRSR